MQAGAKEILIFSYYSTGTVDIKDIYEGLVSVDAHITTGKANLTLRPIALADNRFFEHCGLVVLGPLV